jgi:hypothetical protein
MGIVDDAIKELESSESKIDQCSSDIEALQHRLEATIKCLMTLAMITAEMADKMEKK